MLKGLAEYLDLSLWDLLEGIALHAFEQKPRPNAEGDRAAEGRSTDWSFEPPKATGSMKATEETVHGTSQRVRLTGTIRVPTTTGDALELFTLTGERAWVEGWDPVFPVDPMAGETEPGTTFVTDHHGVVTAWTVARYEPGDVVEYARFTPDDRAGLVQVRCSAKADGSTAATVSYRPDGVAT